MGCCCFKSETRGKKRGSDTHHLYPSNDPYGKLDFIGEMSRGRRNGFGTLRWKDGRTFEGSFISDLAHGPGKFWWDPPQEGQPAEGDPELQEWSYGVRSYHGDVPFKNVKRDDASTVPFLCKERQISSLRIMRLPFDTATVRVLSSGPAGHFAAGDGEFAWDFGLPIGAAVLCAKGGVVLRFADHFPEGRAEKSFRGKDNFIVIKHDDGTLGTYCHLLKSGIKVKQGERVQAGCVLGLSGNSGYSSGPHLHFHVATEADSHMFIQNPVSFSGDASDTNLFFCELPNVCYGPDGPISDHFEGGLDECGLWQGDGVLHRADGAEFTGHFESGEFHGRGKLVYGETDRLNHFEGNFQHGERSGVGTLEWADGRTYTGEWDANLICGNGVLRYAPDDRYGRVQYEGEFYKDMRHGHGRLEWYDGKSFEGEWVNDAAPDMVQGKPTTQTLLNKKRAPARKKSNYN